MGVDDGMADGVAAEDKVEPVVHQRLAVDGHEALRDSVR
jgi:hypothetical protein